ncbi:hypothetical protein R1sor_025129 [Riccia sorocarpa]|uniref:Uncharacterized protein n=1 Tax=Riccia sorocarpa TaxID=122646 RepID=A0ABD3G986_9MARC
MGERSPQQDVEFHVDFELIPTSEELEPVELEIKGLVLGDQRSSRIKSFIWKKVDNLKVGDVEEEDTSRVFCGHTGKLLLCFHHAGKNPYQQGDSEQAIEGKIRYATGYNGMVSFYVEKDLFSSRGRNFVRDPEGKKTYFTVMDVDGFAMVYEGDEQETNLGMFTSPEFVRDTHGMAIVNVRKEILASIKKSPRPLLKNISFGDGPEFQIDVAPGVDWTTVLAIAGGFGQLFVDQYSDSLGEAFSETIAALVLSVFHFTSDFLLHMKYPVTFQIRGRSLYGLKLRFVLIASADNQWKFGFSKFFYNL